MNAADSLDTVSVADLNREIAADLARKGVKVHAVETRVDLTTQIAAESAVAHHLGTDITAERCARWEGDQDAWSFHWENCTGGVHRVTARSLGVRITFAVDLVLGTVVEVA